MIFWLRGDSAPSALTDGEIRLCRESELVLSAGFIGNRRALESGLEGVRGEGYRALVARHFGAFGVSTPERITGEFSFVQWDAENRRLIAATDRAGNHPLYVLEQGGSTRVSFSLEELLPHLEYRRPDPRSVAAHVCGDLIDPESTFYESVRAVGPGRILEMTQAGQRESRYWSLEQGSVLELASDGDYAEALRDLVTRVVAEYLPSGPFGVFLSGGLDSTSVAAAARRGAPQARITAVRAVSPGLPQEDEGGLSEKVVERLRMEDLSVDGGALLPFSGTGVLQTDVTAPLQGILWRANDAVLKAARGAGIQYVLTGSGGDELFGSRVYSYPDLLLSGGWLRLVRELREHRMSGQLTWNGLLRRMILSPAIGPFVGSLRRRFKRPVPWLGKRLRRHVPQPAKLRRKVSATLPGRLRRMQILSSPLVATYHAHWVRHAKRWGIGIRNPFMDHRLQEFAVSLPSTQTFRSGVNKWILRNAMRDDLPAVIVDQTRKLVPRQLAHQGLRAGIDGIFDLLHGMRAAQMGFVDEKRVRAEYQAFLEGRNSDLDFWHALTLEAWLRQHFS